ncbi:hypothetical protein H7F50_13610 [Novosphingobium flavum]|uniref:hypothetical protein n=1 Tax=Novosphingobium aerophilum TaxID=2839843 RepID=UPI001639B5A1|nr:hypothetical protein [Novosphingobium aerophilum]MBC2662790.1 hypothetical protein [Novosphingobium aerophilum]
MQVEVEDGHRDLDMGEWAVADADDILETGGASTCGIVAVLNHTQKRAWLVHQPTPYMTPDETNVMLSNAADDRQPDDCIEICLAGCGPCASQAEDQGKLLELLRNYFPNLTPHLNWGKKCICLKFDGPSSSWIHDYQCP